MEAYANRGLIYLQDKWDNEKILFASPFVFVDILQDLPYNNKQSLDIDSIPASDNIWITYKRMTRKDIIDKLESVEIDLREIKLAYSRLYKRDMIQDIRDDTSGDYKKILTEICMKC